MENIISAVNFKREKTQQVWETIKNDYDVVLAYGLFTKLNEFINAIEHEDFKTAGLASSLANMFLEQPHSNKLAIISHCLYAFAASDEDKNVLGLYEQQVSDIELNFSFILNENTAAAQIKIYNFLYFYESLKMSKKYNIAFQFIPKSVKIQFETSENFSEIWIC